MKPETLVGAAIPLLFVLLLVIESRATARDFEPVKNWRAMHRFSFLWLGMHQLHHSARRVDLAGAYFAHPFEIMAKVGLATLVTAFLLGLTPLAVALTSVFTASASMFQHTNIHTPRWLGYFLQRPESHCLHHEYNVHARNYSDLPLWDIVFGTFHNPQSFKGKVGFQLSSGPRVADMLLMRDASQDEEPQ